MATVFEPIKPVPPITTIFMTNFPVYSPQARVCDRAFPEHVSCRHALVTWTNRCSPHKRLSCSVMASARSDRTIGPDAMREATCVGGDRERGAHAVHRA